MINIFVTGAHGFVGTYFIGKYSNIYNMETFSFQKNNLSNLCLENIQVVLHLSALVHQMGGASLHEYERINVIQTLDLAKKAKNAGVGHFIFMSTIKVYGEESHDIYNEQSVCNPQDAYGQSKHKAELELQKLQDESFIVSIIRTPIVYGYGVKANIKSLILLIKKVPILPFGGIYNKRSMVYIGNLCHLIVTVIAQRQSGIFLAGDDHPISTTKFIELIAGVLGKKIHLIKIPFFEQLLKLFKPSFHKRLYDSLEVSNLRSKYALGLKNPYSIEEGIQYMINGELL